jgi:serine/threonine protein kinase
MSPEQATGMVDEIDHRTDQWALACIAWEMLSAQPPFVAEEPSALLYQVVNIDPKPLAERVPTLPPGVEPVLRRALSKKMDNRFPSIADFSRAFEVAALGHPAVSTPPPVLVSSAPGAEDAISGAGQTMASAAAAGDEPVELMSDTGRNTAAPLTTFSPTGGEQENLQSLRRIKYAYPIAAAVGLILLGGGVLVFSPRAVRPTVTPSRAVPASVVVPLQPPISAGPLPPPPVPSPRSKTKSIESGEKAPAAMRKAPKKHAKHYLIQEL